MPFYLKGEIGSFLLHRSGHAYFSLKDAKSQIRVTFFGGAAACARMGLRNGDEVECFGKLTVYETKGEYQFNIKNIRRAGVGDLQRRFEELKKRLGDEGLFVPVRKKKLPVLPRTIGVVTAPTGAAVRDFCKLLFSRFPGFQVRIYGAQVQGAGAAAEVAKGIDFFNRTHRADVIVITRGGGSMEDLWAFNEEILARAIAASTIPVISAVGHEIDFTIADFVADVRAETPSAAASLLGECAARIPETLDRDFEWMKNTVRAALDRAKLRFSAAAAQLSVEGLQRRLEMRQHHLDELAISMEHDVQLTMERAKTRMELLFARLQAANPHAALKRGYTLLRDCQTGRLLRSAAQSSGLAVEAEFADGKLKLHTD